ncbi:MAG: lipoprotein [Rhodobacteraceae bacterium]|nr:lipoprotein [Paracoccaceae bacterium]
MIRVSVLAALLALAACGVDGPPIPPKAETTR